MLCLWRGMSWALLALLSMSGCGGHARDPDCARAEAGGCPER